MVTITHKMKKLITLASMLIVLSSQAQNATKDSNGNYHAIKHEYIAKDSGKRFQDAKGIWYNVYISEKGKLYYWKLSKTNKLYKRYIKLQ